MTKPNISKLKNDKFYKKALESQALGDGIEALRLFTELSEKGHMLAQHQLAKIHLDEHSGDEDALSEAVRLFKLAAKQGYVDSAFNLGTLYESGQHIKKSVAEAYYWYRVASRAGDVESQEILDSIDSLVFSVEDNSYEFSCNDSYYADVISAANDLCQSMDDATLKQLFKALQEKWSNEYGLAVESAKKQKIDLANKDLSKFVPPNKGYSYLADIVEFIENNNVTSSISINLDKLLNRFDQMMNNEQARESEVNGDLAIKANKLAFNDYDPDLNTEVELVLFLRDIYPVEFEQATLNQSLDEGEGVEFPTLGRVAELIGTENEIIFLKNIEKFYAMRGYKK